MFFEVEEESKKLSLEGHGPDEQGEHGAKSGQDDEQLEHVQSELHEQWVLQEDTDGQESGQKQEVEGHE